MISGTVAFVIAWIFMGLHLVIDHGSLFRDEREKRQQQPDASPSVVETSLRCTCPARFMITGHRAVRCACHSTACPLWQYKVAPTKAEA